MMPRHAWITVVLLAGCPAKQATTTTSTDNGGGDDGPGFWHVLAVEGSSWTLDDTMQEEAPQQLIVTVAEVRAVGDAEVVRLSWDVRYDPDSEPEDAAAQSVIGEMQWAITPRGLWMLGGELDDDGVAAAISGAPTWASPPVAFDRKGRGDGLFAEVETRDGELIACIGEIPDLGDEECSEVCGGGMCIAERDGIVEVDGQWGPDSYAMFQQAAYRR